MTDTSPSKQNDQQTSGKASVNEPIQSPNIDIFSYLYKELDVDKSEPKTNSKQNNASSANSDCPKYNIQLSSLGTSITYPIIEGNFIVLVNSSERACFQNICSKSIIINFFFKLIIQNNNLYKYEDLDYRLVGEYRAQIVNFDKADRPIRLGFEPMEKITFSCTSDSMTKNNYSFAIVEWFVDTAPVEWFKSEVLF